MHRPRLGAARVVRTERVRGVDGGYRPDPAGVVETATQRHADHRQRQADWSIPTTTCSAHHSGADRVTSGVCGKGGRVIESADEYRRLHDSEVPADKWRNGMRGCDSVQDLHEVGHRLSEDVEQGEPMRPLDWGPSLLATERVFGSNVVGSGLDWEVSSGFSDAVSVKLLRAIQRKLPTAGVIGVALGTRAVGTP